jgi:multidrug efflux pump
VKLFGEVARVLDDVENNRLAAWVNGTRSVLVIIRRQPGANIIETNDRVRALLTSLMRSISPGRLLALVALCACSTRPRVTCVGRAGC